MPGTRALYETALTRRQQLHDAAAYSLPENLGTTAIYWPYQGDCEWSQADAVIFHEEALLLADKLYDLGKHAEVIENGQRHDMHVILKSPEISTVITIGHGALSRLNILPEPGTMEQEYGYDWLDVSRQADHLKTGRFIQRQCGHRSRDFSMPLGAFAMQRFDQVWAAIGGNFRPRDLTDPANDRIRPVTGEPSLEYDEAKILFGYEPAEKFMGTGNPS